MIKVIPCGTDATITVAQVCMAGTITRIMLRETIIEYEITWFANGEFKNDWFIDAEFIPGVHTKQLIGFIQPKYKKDGERTTH